MPKNENSSRKSNAKRTNNKHLIRFLVSCCLFLFVLCGCFLAALVLIGKHYVHNVDLTKYYEKNNLKSSKSEMLIARLSDDIIPLHYDLTLYPNIESGDFKGKVNITVQTFDISKVLIIHSNNLTIKSVRLQHANYTNDEDDIKITKIEESHIDEALLIYPNQTISPGFYYLYLEFSGSLLNKIVGFYTSQYFDEFTNETRTIATSKFEPTYARQAYPCFDEPNKKAKFTVHLLKPKDENYVALSNMPQVNEEETDDGILVHFQESVKMSTYLSCFIVSDFTYTENFILPEKYNIPFRVYATPAQLNKTELATEIGVKIIEFFIDYFKIPYPLPKLDLVAIPDFVSGAMEHWGLVTFRETALLYDETISSTTNKQRVATVIAHELAHSWFGNLVTINWWNDLWLNEGFASYIEYKGVNAVFPDWDVMSMFLIDDLHPVLGIDDKLSSHPIVQTVVTPDQITSIFDSISYKKGASVLRMLEDVVTETKFQQGITNYLNAHLYDNAVTQNLLDELQKIVGDELNITSFMNTWTNQMGYPILNVKTDDDTYTLTQKRFLRNMDDDDKVEEVSPFNYKWTIPVTYITDENSTPKYVWFKYDMDKVVIKKPSTAKWIKFNYNQIGYYRVNYDNWDNLVDNINEMSIADKTHLLEETFSIAAAGQLNYNIPLDLIKYLSNEYNYLPWSVASTKIISLHTYLTNSEKLTKFEKVVQNIIDPIYRNLTWNEDVSDGHLQRLARVKVLALACKVGHSDCLKEAKTQFKQWLNGKRVLSQDLRQIAYNYGMQEASSNDWDQLWNKFVSETDAGEKIRLLSGLASVQQPALLLKLIELAKTDKYIRKQDYFSCLSFISRNPTGRLLVWDYVRENWLNLVERFTLNDRYLGQLIPTIVGTFSTTTKRDEIVAFFEKYPEAGAGLTARKRALEIVNNNIKWLSINKIIVEDWIENQNV